jgi:hypothetical protein
VHWRRLAHDLLQYRFLRAASRRRFLDTGASGQFFERGAAVGFTGTDEDSGRASLPGPGDVRLSFDRLRWR